jgi:hypothetical protein
VSLNPVLPHTSHQRVCFLCCCRWVIQQLQVDGEDLVGRVAALDLLLAGLICLAEPYGHTTTTTTHQQQQQQEQQQQGALQQQQQQQQQQLASWPWWAMRAVMLQQHVLSGRCVTLQTSLKQLMAATLAWSQQHAAAAADATGDQQQQQQQQNGVDSPTAEAAVKAQALLAAAHMEVAAIQQSLGAVEGAQQQLEAASAALGVSVELTGALGMRTKHQVDPKAQMIAAVRAASGGAGNNSSSSDGRVAAAVGLHGVDVASLGFEEVGLTKELEGMIDDSAVYLAPRIMQQQQQPSGAGGDAEQEQQQQQQQTNGAPSPPAPAAGQQQQQTQQMSPLLQALLLGYAAQIKKSGGKDELQQWQIAPFVEAVLQQTQTQYLLHATARLLKCRCVFGGGGQLFRCAAVVPHHAWLTPALNTTLRTHARHEKERGRTRERALMQLEQLCSALRGAQPGVGARLPCAFGVRFPLWPLLQKELAEFYIAMGFVGELWCHWKALVAWCVVDHAVCGALPWTCSHHQPPHQHSHRINTGAALKIFEGLEMWDQLIVCYRLLGKKQVAQELVLARLQVRSAGHTAAAAVRSGLKLDSARCPTCHVNVPVCCLHVPLPCSLHHAPDLAHTNSVTHTHQADPSDAKLWCALGDITEGGQHYAKAWEVSGHRSSRAQRSLGRCVCEGRRGRGWAGWGAARSLNLSLLLSSHPPPQHHTHAMQVSAAPQGVWRCCCRL